MAIVWHFEGENVGWVFKVVGDVRASETEGMHYAMSHAGTSDG